MAELDTQRIAAAALALISRKGTAAFTMRGVAQELGVTPMALYHHVRNKAELAALVVEAANAQHPLPQPSGDWREDIWAMARLSRELMLALPTVAALRRTYQIWTADLLQKSEYWVSLWLQSGLDAERAARAAVASSMAILAMVSEESVHSTTDAPHESLLAAKQHARLLFATDIDRDALFELAARGLIEGIHARLMQEQSQPARRRKAPMKAAKSKR